MVRYVSASFCFVDFGKNEDINIFDLETEKKLQEVLTLDEIEIIKTKRGIEHIKLKSKILNLLKKEELKKSAYILSTSLLIMPYLFQNNRGISCTTA